MWVPAYPGINDASCPRRYPEVLSLRRPAPQTHKLLRPSGSTVDHSTTGGQRWKIEEDLFAHTEQG